MKNTSKTLTIEETQSYVDAKNEEYKNQPYAPEYYIVDENDENLLIEEDIDFIESHEK